MAGQSRKWMILVATIWIQAFTGTNFDFSAYSSNLKSVLGISQVQLNYLATASDLGKAFGWSSGLALMYFPLWSVLFMAAFMGLIGYGLQWLVIQNIISLPYILVFLLCLLAGLSICWFNTVCFVLCIQNFPVNRALALALTISFNGVSPALYTLAAKAISLTNNSLYLILNSLIPIIVSLAALVPILRQPPLSPLPADAVRRDSLIFLILNVIAILTGLYLLLLNPMATTAFTSRLLFCGAVVLLVVPLCIPGIVVARDWARRTIHTSFHLEGSGFNLVDVDDLELHRELLIGREDYYKNNDFTSNGYSGGHTDGGGAKERSLERLMGMHSLSVLGEEHSVASLVQRWDFWFYYMAYLCGGTIGLVYSNNLGQIAQSLGDASSTTRLVTIYSSCSFFGRLLAAAPDFLRGKLYFARTGWFMIALIPTPIAFFILAASHGGIGLHIGTSLIGLSSGFIFAAAVSITSELFGPKSVGVNHNILITNIPLGSLVYGLLAAIVYDANIDSGGLTSIFDVGATGKVCMGRGCYLQTFLSWAFISLFGLVCSLLLFLRTKMAYDRFEENRILTQQY